MRDDTKNGCVADYTRTDRSAEMFLELKNPNRHMGSLEALKHSLRDIKTVPFNINLLLFPKLLSFVVFYVKVRRHCRPLRAVKSG